MMSYWRAPLDINTIEVPHGDVHIDIEQCKGCEFCIEYCPKEVLELSKDFNRKGYHYPVVLKLGACVNCTLCEMICPEFSIFVVEGKPSHPDINDVLKKEAKS
jgi:2-oxoglutarate ferredoxin oxidoreductase subunit delta